MLCNTTPPQSGWYWPPAQIVFATLAVLGASCGSAPDPDGSPPDAGNQGPDDPDGVALPCGVERPATGYRWIKVDAPQSPPARANHGMAYDVERQKVVVFGGSPAAGGFINDTWVMEGGAWSEVDPATIPPARRGLALVHDRGRNLTVMFGGEDQAGKLSDLWEFDGEDWSQIVPEGVSPPARSDHAMAYDEVRGVTLLFGGSGDDDHLADTWQFDGSEWTEIVSELVPPARSHHAMAFDAAAGLIVMAGGIEATADTWVFDGQTWSEMVAAAYAGGRWGPALAYDQKRAATVLMGGVDETSTSVAPFFHDTWELSYGADWAEVPVEYIGSATPFTRYDHQMVYHEGCGAVVAFGGHQFEQPLVSDETWLYWGPPESIAQ